MILEENEKKISQLEEELLSLDPSDSRASSLKLQLKELKQETYSNLSAWDKVLIARSEKRIKAKALIDKLITNFIELHGDQYYSDDASIIAGLGFLGDMPITVLAQAKGENLNDNLKRNFGMTSPEGFRKTLRLAKEAEKFHRPILTIVDTSGAYPGKGAEERGQARAIAENLYEFSKLKTPVISIILSEGGSGGALALTVSDHIYMFENAVYSVLSPEGFTSILFKDKVPVREVAEVMKLTSQDLINYGIADEIVEEPLGGIRYVSDKFAKELKERLVKKFTSLMELSEDELLNKRYEKFRRIGSV
ncbi:acetyl-CoA carboxylase carboxyl transferase subunit alpha [Anaeroplasma bactoclasticum]|jgi:acetyl-CoA carboxylase carboxyl transferase subunit alpha|uniref:Acetyl-coenzyme A carboxylase carboxyl transferase subunit alpha n=1 Tax=Anaeroplasma bactoclasticum TaxID=2088 RepID=A0A397QV78_9MOLU|nr:acetyl-CoA carboxylase carboxyltransferase subunit alpha [Anaeroplasma bactoclasticum]RIA64952.1 acetyl-CoA carboxylase carboxyl transferase subunit alpha [Anaeroplasma bactoclasticum]